MKKHVQVYAERTPPALLKGEKLTYKPVQIEIDPQTKEDLQSTSRVDLSQLYTVHHNLKFCSIGEVKEEHYKTLKVLIRRELS
jgi:hypothetical protein